MTTGMSPLASPPLPPSLKRRTSLSEDEYANEFGSTIETAFTNALNATISARAADPLRFMAQQISRQAEAAESANAEILCDGDFCQQGAAAKSAQNDAVASEQSRRLGLSRVHLHQQLEAERSETQEATRQHHELEQQTAALQRELEQERRDRRTPAALVPSDPLAPRPAAARSRWHMWESSPLLEGLSGEQLACARRVEWAGGYSKSQFQEDVLLLPYLLALAGMPGAAGTFVELGAVDGLKYSNTLLLERCFGWRGLLVEGNPASYAALRRNVQRGARSARTRAAHSAVCAGRGVVNFTAGGNEMAGQPELMGAAYLKMVRGRNHVERTVQV